MAEYSMFGPKDPPAAETPQSKLARLEAELRWRENNVKQGAFGLYGKTLRADIARLEKQITPLRAEVRQLEEAAERARNRVTIPKDLTFKAAATPNETAAGQKITAPSLKGLFKPK